MPHDEELAGRISGLVGILPDVEEKRMFGGLAFLWRGHILIAASSKGGLMARVDPEERAELLEQPGVEPMVMGGREPAGWLRVEAAEVQDDEALEQWVARGMAVVRALPPD